MFFFFHRKGNELRPFSQRRTISREIVFLIRNNQNMSTWSFKSLGTQCSISLCLFNHPTLVSLVLLLRRLLLVFIKFLFLFFTHKDERTPTTLTFSTPKSRATRDLLLTLILLLVPQREKKLWRSFLDPRASNNHLQVSFIRKSGGILLGVENTYTRTHIYAMYSQHNHPMLSLS